MGAGEDGREGVRRGRAHGVRDRRRGDRRHARVLAQRPGHEGGPRSRSPACSGAATPRSVVRHATLTADDFAALERRPPASGAATAATSAASRWRSAGSGTRSTASACWSQAHDADGQLRGFLSFVPWGRNGLSLDLMRRDPTADNGLVELMVASLAGQARDLRHRPGLAQLRDVPRGVRARRRDRRRAGASGSGGRRCCWRAGTGSSSRSTAPTRSTYPTWQPRFMCFEYASDLPRVGTAAGSAEGFLTTPVDLDAAPRTATPTTTLDTGGARARGRRPRADPAGRATSSPRRCRPSTCPSRCGYAARKLDRLREQGIDPYPVDVPAHPHARPGARARPGDLAARHRDRAYASRWPAGCMLKRDMGKLGFATLRDGSGDLQVMVDARHVGAEGTAFWEHEIDLGDHVGVTGEVITTHTRRADRPRRVRRS